VKPDPNRKVEEWIDIALFGKGRQPMIDPPKKGHRRDDSS
jgi:hypothetical protein